MQMTRPKPFFFMCGSASLASTKLPRAFSRVMRSYFLIGVSSMGCHHSADALLITMSRRPKRSTVFSTQFSMDAASSTSVRTGRASAPSSDSSLATEKIVPGCPGASSVDLAATTMWHPSRASARAHSLPIPRVAPVTMATRPFRPRKFSLPAKGERVVECACFSTVFIFGDRMESIESSIEHARFETECFPFAKVCTHPSRATVPIGGGLIIAAQYDFHSNKPYCLFMGGPFR
mmetsp:Transcript_27879/g.63839  ORF Transcript_27879/g.63839 Transcript_27879/m.63839 type:complete len:234 (-) Transcript_27879:85-786(-)